MALILLRRVFDRMDLDPFISELKYRRLIQNATLTSPMSAGTSISGPTTPTKASPDFNPKTATSTGIASSKLLPAACRFAN
jgi:hypothetical protein